MSKAPTSTRGVNGKRLLLITLTSQFERLVEVVGFLLLLPVIVSSVGVTDFGVWNLVWAIVSLYALLDLGFSMAIVRFVAHARGANDSELERRTIATLFWIFVAQAVILALASLSFTPLSDLILGNNAGEKGQLFRQTFAVVALGYCLQLPLTIFRGILVSYQKAWVGHLYRILGNGFYFTGLALWLPAHPSLIDLAWINWGVTVVPGILIAIHVLYHMPQVTVHPRHFAWKRLKEMWGFSLALSAIQICLLIATRADALIVNAFLTLEAVSFYGVAARIADQARSFCIQVTHAVTPIVAELHGAGDQAKMRKVWLLTTRYTMTVAFPILGCVIILAEPLLTLWMGQDFIAAVLPLQLLVGAVLTSLLFSASQAQLSMSGQEVTLAKAMLSGQTLNIVFSALIAPFYGLVGIAAVTFVVPLVSDLCWVQPKVAKTYRAGGFEFINETLRSNLFAASISLIPLSILAAWHPPQNLLILAGYCVVTGFTFLIGFLLVSPVEREVIFRKILSRKVSSA